MKRAVLVFFLSLLCVGSAFAAFDPTQPYAQAANACGGAYKLQGGTFYDTNNNSVGSSLPSCNPNPLKTVGVIAQSATASSVTGTLAVTALATIPLTVIPANSTIRVTTTWTTTNNANTKSVSITLNGQTVGGGGFTSLPGGQVDGRILNNAAQSAQVSYFSSGGTGGIFGSSPTATTVNTAIPQTLLINGQLGNVGDTMTLNGYCVELLQQ